MRIATVIILLMAMLNLIPPLFAGGVYFDNAYYIILYALLSFVGISLPFIVDLPKYLTAISHILGGWFVTGLFYEVLNLAMPDIVLNTNASTYLFTKFTLCFMVAITFIMINFTWKKNN